MGIKGGKESDLVRQVLAYLALRQIPSFRLNAGCIKVGKRLIRLAPAGAPDVLAILPPAGRVLGVEVKRRGGRVRPAQKAFLAALAGAGGLALVISDVRRLQEALELLG